MRGSLILIEGLDRTGKSTQASLLAEKLNAKLVKFPDRSTPIGQIINSYLVDKSVSISDQSAHLLFCANRWECAASIQEELLKGNSIVIDRYVYSGVAYSLAKDVPGMNSYEWLVAPDRGLPKPDLTLFLTIDINELANRKGYGEERYEQIDFQHKVKQCFLDILPKNDKSVQIVDVSKQTIEQVTEKLWTVITDHGLEKGTDAPIEVLN